MLLGQFTVDGAAHEIQIATTDEAGDLVVNTAFSWSASILEPQVAFQIHDPLFPFFDAQNEWFSSLFSQLDCQVAWDTDWRFTIPRGPLPMPLHSLPALFGHDLVGQHVESLVITPSATDWTARFYGEVPEPTSMALAVMMCVVFVFKIRSAKLWCW